MSHKYTPVEFSVEHNLIHHNAKVLSIGSCFSDNIGNRFAEHGYSTLVNPTGIVYNPYSLAKSIQYIKSGLPCAPTDIHLNGEVYFHYDFHSKMSSLDKREAIGNINAAIQEAHEFWKETDVVLLTLGTSIIHVREGDIVANCHKVPSKEFQKRMLSVEESVDELSNVLKGLDGKLILITVSPIRHTREGLVENQRSKSRLIEVAHALTERFDFVSYFPAYEMMMDELRDYRYYGKDMIHPSDEAIDIIWNRFNSTKLSEKAIEKVKEFGEFNALTNHCPQFPDSIASKKLMDAIKRKELMLSEKYPK